MNPLTFFPPPSRSLSRVDSRPGGGNSNGGNSGGGGSAGSTRSNSSKRAGGMQPLTSAEARPRMHSNGPSSSSSSRHASGTTTPEHESTGAGSTSSLSNSQQMKRPLTSPSVSSELLSPRLMASDSANASGYSSDPDAKSQFHQQQGRRSGTSSPRRTGADSPGRPTRTMTSSTTKRSHSFASNSSNNSGSSASTATGGRLGHRLPQGMYFDLVRPGEVGQAHKLERASYSVDDAASLDTLRYRQKEAPHLFIGAFLPLPPPKVSGPLSMSGPAPRKMVAYACGTAASAYTARAIKVHSVDEHAWLVCVHSLCVAQEYRRKGMALKLIEEYIRRLRRVEDGHGDRGQAKMGYECVALLSHDDTMPLFEKAGFKKLGVSHVNVGSGGWYELRRSIKPSDHDEDEEKESSPASDKSKSLAHSPKTAKKEVSTTPTQELERRLHAHAATLGVTSEETPKSSEVVATSADETPSKTSRGLPTPIITNITSDNARDAEDLKMSMSPTVMSPTTEEPPTINKLAPPVDLPSGVPSAVPGAASPFSTAQIMEALRKQTAGSASPAKPGQSQSSRNPGTAYSTIMGQTLASKTSVEDAFYALEARLVNRDDQSSLADLYCPREECSCLLLKAGNADWEFAEMGPLTQANLKLPDSPAPPSAPMPPPPASLDRVRSALGTQRPSSVSTAVHAFWIVHSPMLFENVGFSRDSEWRLPPLPSMSFSSVGSEGTTESNGSNADGSGERKKPTKRGSLLRNASGWIRDQRERRKTDATIPESTRSPTSLSPPRFLNAQGSSGSEGSSSAGGDGLASFASATSAGIAASQPSNTVKVKYLLCADCDCGPLGYTVLPRSLEGGNFAKEVGKQVNGQNGSGPGSDGASSPPQQQESETPLYFVAADRVRYRLPK